MKLSPGYHAHITDMQQTTRVQQTNLVSNIMLSTEAAVSGSASGPGRCPILQRKQAVNDRRADSH
jgi:hypothetical protein